MDYAVRIFIDGRRADLAGITRVVRHVMRVRVMP